MAKRQNGSRFLACATTQPASGRGRLKQRLRSGGVFGCMARIALSASHGVIDGVLATKFDIIFKNGISYERRIGFSRKSIFDRAQTFFAVCAGSGAFAAQSVYARIDAFCYFHFWSISRSFRFARRAISSTVSTGMPPRSATYAGDLFRSSADITSRSSSGRYIRL